MSSPLALFPGRIEDKGIAHEFALVLNAQRNQMRQINGLLDDLNSANHRIASLIREKSAVEAAFDTFRTNVRDMAIEKAGELNWCDPGLNEALIELGLEPKTRRFDVQFTVSQTVTVTVEAADEYTARREAEDNYEGAELVSNYASRYDWEAEVIDVEESDD